MVLPSTVPTPASADLAAIAKSRSSKLPRAFGRTSNVWQCVDTVHSRLSPPPPPQVAARRSTRGPSHVVPGVRSAAAEPCQRQERLGAAVGSKRGSILGNLSGNGPPPSQSMASVKRVSTINAGEIMRRIQSLGTSASAPSLPGAAASAVPSPGPPVNTGAIPPSTAAAAPPATTPAEGIGTAPPVAVSEAERLRNDYNSQYSRLYYGCSIALELFNGHLMMVNCADGRVGVQALEKMQLKGASATTAGRHRAVFTLIDLADVRSANTICYGDAVWLQLSVGTSEFSWEQGGVLGAKVREAPQLMALALADDDSVRNDVPAPAVVGYPVPIRAYLPKTRDDADAQVDELQSRVRNKASKMLGKWVIRSAVQNRRKSSDNFVYNNDEIYLEQDWFYLGADSDAGVAVLLQQPPASVLRDVKGGEYVIERRAAWRIRLLDSSNASTGLSLAQQQMERLLLRAKNQLKQSRKMRAGQVRSYGAELQSGVKFVPQH
ncbi:hypothetical protein ATCC90586_011711 [Pythium insidiosum]|nr:hypothetical protein ATCC90586_011711 [Pythium insidiosum]